MRDLLFILPTFSHFDYASKCLSSFVKHTPQGTYCVAIIDDGSPDWCTNYASIWTQCPRVVFHYNTNAGLTRSWNAGLCFARDHGFKYALCGNSDLLFTANWLEPLKAALEQFDLVGPITNAPGHAPWQNLYRYGCFKMNDDLQHLNNIAHDLQIVKRPARACRYINGFCMLAKTETWWRGAFDNLHVFNPRYKLLGNEDELQVRWSTKRMKIGYVPRSFVFHYRSVSRPEALSRPASKGAYRSASTRRTKEKR